MENDCKGPRNERNCSDSLEADVRFMIQAN
jgi:hypothetical protein